MIDIDLQRHAVIEASAGTGKTHTIEDIVLRLLTERAVPLEQILLVTFTEKATGEMKGRLRQRLEKEAREASEHQSVLQAAIDSFDQASICTIHGFCQRVLQEFAVDSRQELGGSLVDDGELLEGCLRELQRRHWRKEYGARLPLILELAGYARPRGAGNWEKQVCELARRFRPRCGHELRPAVDDTWLAALDELEAGIRRVLPRMRQWAGQPLALERIEEHPWYHGFAQLSFKPSQREERRTFLLLPLLRWLADPATTDEPLRTFWRLLEQCRSHKRIPFDDDGFSLLTDLLPPRAQQELPRFCPNLQKTVEMVNRIRRSRAISALSEKLMVRTVRQLQDQLAAVKRDREQHSFEDLLTLVDDALDPARNRRAAAVCRAIRDHYQFAIIDEFQDTDPIQWRIFKRIFVDSDQGHRLFIVGDPKQAIFGFRGGDLDTFVQARDELLHTYAASPSRLTINWRSDPNLLDALNRLFGDGKWFPGSDVTYTPVSAPAESDRRHALIADRSQRAALTLVDFRWCKRLKQAHAVMGRWIAGEIQHLLGCGGDAPVLDVMVRDQTRPLQAGDICILVGRRREAGPLLQALREARIPYSLYKQQGLWESSEAIHLEYLLRALARPHDPASFRKALLTRFCRLRPEDLAGSTEIPAGHPLHDMFENWRGWAETRRWSELFQSLLEQSGVLFEAPDSPDAERSLANFRCIIQGLEQAAYSQDLDIFGVIDFLAEQRRRQDLDSGVQPIETDDPRVRILTIHAAKGLEFPVVFLAGGFTPNRGSAWHTWRHPADRRLVFDLDADEYALELAGQEADAEERRKLYVALTRAMFKLYVPLLEPQANYHTAPGPVLTILNQAIVEARLTDQESEQVGTLPGEDRPVHFLPMPRQRSRKPAASLFNEIEPPADLFPEVDRGLSQRRTWIHSFSSLHRGILAAAPLTPIHLDRPLRSDDDTLDPLDESGLLRGPTFGELVHAVLEKIDFAEVLRAETASALSAPRTAARTLIDEQMARFLIDLPIRPSSDFLADGCRKLIAEMVWNGLRTPLAALGGCLAQVPEEDRQQEMEFLLPRSEGKPSWGTRRLDEYLAGIIDLVVRRQDRFFLVDWKTNQLAGWSRDEVGENVQDCDYPRQYRLYLHALARWLRTRQGRAFNPARDLGGVYYLYLRGMNGKDETAGVWFTPVTESDLDLQRVFADHDGLDS